MVVCPSLSSSKKSQLSATNSPRAPPSLTNRAKQASKTVPPVEHPSPSQRECHRQRAMRMTRAIPRACRSHPRRSRWRAPRLAFPWAHPGAARSAPPWRFGGHLRREFGRNLGRNVRGDFGGSLRGEINWNLGGDLRGHPAGWRRLSRQRVHPARHHADNNDDYHEHTDHGLALPAHALPPPKRPVLPPAGLPTAHDLPSNGRAAGGSTHPPVVAQP